MIFICVSMNFFRFLVYWFSVKFPVGLLKMSRFVTMVAPGSLFYWPIGIGVIGKTTLASINPSMVVAPWFSSYFPL